MKIDGNGGRGLVETNNRIWDAQKESRNVLLDDQQGLGSSEEGESRFNENVGNGSEAAVQIHASPQQQSQGPVICWDRFLPIRSLKVLLVENDDSTRHVVSALLRNCSYEVTAVANGIQAWKILEDLSNHIDLVLTEVVMPFLSGIGLLSKLMSHKTFKNIPVIMMSSHDSMGIVFKCLSKGAVDFLVKPIRKNELKNLWQHVWRRCHSSSGSGSESGTQTKRSVKLKSNDESDNTSSSSDERDNGSIGLSIRDGSDNGSGTQSSWTKRAAQVDSPRPISEWDQLADAPDSTCAQVIHTKPESFSNRWVHRTDTKERPLQNEQLDNVAMGQDLEMGITRNSDLQLKLPELGSKPIYKGHAEQRSEGAKTKVRDQTANLISVLASCNKPNGNLGISQMNDKASCSSKESPSLELSLKRLRGVGDIGTVAQDDCHVLRHSDQSAFSKYNTTSSANQVAAGKVGSCSPLENGSVKMKAETALNSTSPPNQQSNGSSNNNDMASTSKYVTPKPESAITNKSESTMAFKYYNPPQNGHVCPPVQRKADDVAINTAQAQTRGSPHQVQVQHHHHYYHHYHHHVHNPQLENDELSQNNMAAAAPQCGSSNICGGGAVEGNIANHRGNGNYSVNGSASGSNHGSNGQNGSSTALNAGGQNMESDNGVAGNSGVGGLNGRISGNPMDEDRFAQREAALTKFRQKRKERCFEKKVRYQSRKRLAEQRPRVRGQFVRQIMSGTKGGNDSQQNDLVSGDDSCDR